MVSEEVKIGQRINKRLFLRSSQRTDLALLAVTLLLVAIGLIMMYSASYIKAYSSGRSGLAYFENQAIYAGLGIVIMMMISHFNYRLLHILSWPVWLFYFVSLGLLFMTLFSKNSSKRWLGVGDMFSFQPSELVKFAIILFVSHIASMNPERMRELKYGFFQPIIILLSFVLIMTQQPHYSGIIIISLLMIIMMFIGGAKLEWFIIIGAIGIVLALLLLNSSRSPEYVGNRVYSWLDPGGGVGDHYQTDQSVIAIGSGGFSGLGLGNSRQKHHFLPEPQNDFLFAIVCEELGFIGALLVIILFIIFITRGLAVSLKAKDRFGAMLAIGIATQIGLQVILNIAVVTDMIPNTGISLPFFSQGGTSLIVLLAEVGILLSVARNNNQKEKLTKEVDKS